MNLLATLADNEVVTVRALVNKHQTLRLKKGLIDAGIALDYHQLHPIRDEIIIWDDEGNVLFLHVVNQIGFQEVSLRNPNNPSAKGVIVASLNDTKKVLYEPISTIKKVDEGKVEDLENNVLYFYRSDHPDTMPFMSVSPLWLAVPEFQTLLSTFSAGDYSALDSITHVSEPKCNITAILPLSTRQKYPENVFPAFFETVTDFEDRIA